MCNLSWNYPQTLASAKTVECVFPFHGPSNLVDILEHLSFIPYHDLAPPPLKTQRIPWILLMP